jgi:hypothetical protein
MPTMSASSTRQAPAENVLRSRVGRTFSNWMAEHGTIRAKYLDYVRFPTKAIIFSNFRSPGSEHPA